MNRLASRSPAAPFQTSRPAPMLPGQQQRKDSQDEARRQQQADEKIRELEEENERLREAMSEALFAFDHGRSRDAASHLRNALDGGGGQS